MRVLFVDDEPDLLELGRLFLKKENNNLDVETTACPKKGLEKLECEDFDAVISDYDMPKMDGLEFYENLKKKNKNLPFIVFTGSGRDGLAEEAKEKGVDHYIKKGGNPKAKFSELAECVVQEVENRGIKEEA